MNLRVRHHDGQENAVLRILWLATLLLAALGLVMGGAHVLKLPVRMQYEPSFYMQVTSTLYRYFGLVGGPVPVAHRLPTLSRLATTGYTRSKCK